MNKNKNQQDKADTKTASQLPIDFKPKKEANVVVNHSLSGKVISIKAITEQKKRNLVMDIIRNTKSF